jgi:hypothetical protein
VKLNTRTHSLACLAAFGLLFAVSTSAQTLQLPSQGHQPKAVVGDATDGSRSQRKPKSDAVNPNATQTCTYTFTSGSGATYLQFCVTVNGNIVEFNSPQGVEQLSQGGALEGYGICDTSTMVGYYDYAYTDSGNWNPPTTVTHTATEVKIERTTSDGAWTLTQTIVPVPGTNPYAKITMALKNNSGVTKLAYLLRYGNADPDAAGSSGNYYENYDGSNDSAWGNSDYSSTNGSTAYGLMLQNVGNLSPTSVPYGRYGFAITGLDGPAPCNSTANMASPITEAEGSIVYFYDFQIKKDETVTVTDRYQSF